MSDWWRAVEDELERLSDDGPDPWGTTGTGSTGIVLTPDQQAFLAQLTETPSALVDATDLGDDPQ